MENHRLADELAHLQAALAAQPATPNLDNENAQLRETLMEQSIRIQEQTRRLLEHEEVRGELEREVHEREEQAQRVADDLEAMLEKVAKLEEELTVQRLTEMELKEILEAIEKEGKKMTDELWLKDSEIVRLREERERLFEEVDKGKGATPKESPQQALAVSGSNLKVSKKDRAGSVSTKERAGSVNSKITAKPDSISSLVEGN